MLSWRGFNRHMIVYMIIMTNQGIMLRAPVILAVVSGVVSVVVNGDDFNFVNAGLVLNRCHVDPFSNGFLLWWLVSWFNVS